MIETIMHVLYHLCAVIGAVVLAVVCGGLLVALVAWPLWRDSKDTRLACRGEHEEQDHD